jgi:excisionase family DNA binding protein
VLHQASAPLHEVLSQVAVLVAPMVSSSGAGRSDCAPSADVLHEKLYATGPLSRRTTTGGSEWRVDVVSERLAYRVAEAAAMVGISRSKMYELIAAGTMPTIRIGTAVRVPADALRAWIEQQTVVDMTNRS